MSDILEPCQVCMELQRNGIDVWCSICAPRVITPGEVQAALDKGAEARKAAEKTLKRSPRR